MRGARALVLDEPLSLWGGLDPASGKIIDIHHPQHGERVTGRTLVMPAARGSSSSASVLAEAARAGTAPAAVVLGEPDLILSIGAAVAEELYGAVIPILVVDATTYATIHADQPVDLAALGASAASSPPGRD